jgi:hypothetical protein
MTPPKNSTGEKFTTYQSSTLAMAVQPFVNASPIGNPPKQLGDFP